MISNQKGKIKSEIININSNEPLFHLYIILANKCSGSCNNINDPHAKLCVSDNAKNISITVFQELMKNVI